MSLVRLIGPLAVIGLAVLVPCASAQAQWYGHRSGQGDLLEVNLQSGAMTVVGNTGVTEALGLAFNPVPVPSATGFYPTGTLFGLGPSGVLYTIDTSTAAMSAVGSTGLTNSPQSLAFDLAGHLLTIGGGNRIYNVSTVDASATQWYTIDDLFDADGLTVNPVPVDVEGHGLVNADTLFAVDNGQLYVINLETFQAEFVGVVAGWQTVAFGPDGTLYSDNGDGGLYITELNPLNDVFFTNTAPSVEGSAVRPAPDAPCVNQPPITDAPMQPFSDADCDGCIDADVQVLADNFVLEEAQALDLLRFWGLYTDDVPLEPDRFTVIFWTDAGGLPGTTISRSGPQPATTRALSGNQAGLYDEYEYTIDLDPDLGLGAGTYWVEIYNDTGDCPWDCEAVPDGAVGVTDFLALLAQWGGPGPCDFDGGGVGVTDFLAILGQWGACPAGDWRDWVWEFGFLDPVCGIPDSAFSLIANDQEQWLWTSDEQSLQIQCAESLFDCPGEGDCCVAHDGAGCLDLDCCEVVCAFEPFCCYATWASLCVGWAEALAECSCEAPLAHRDGNPPSP